jgi:YEATS domain-containing protein 4
LQEIAFNRVIVYGNVAKPLGDEKGTDPLHTHKWSIFVRGVAGEDISYFVKKVVFKLHETYPNPVRSMRPFNKSGILI